MLYVSITTQLNNISVVVVIEVLINILSTASSKLRQKYFQNFLDYL